MPREIVCQRVVGLDALIRWEEPVFKIKNGVVEHREAACGRVATELYKCVIGGTHKVEDVHDPAISHRPFDTHIPLAAPEKYRPLIFVGDVAGDEAEEGGAPLGVPHRDDATDSTLFSARGGP